MVTGLVYSKQFLLLGMLVLLLHFIPGSKYLPPAKKVNFSHCTDQKRIKQTPAKFSKYSHSLEKAVQVLIGACFFETSNDIGEVDVTV